MQQASVFDLDFQINFTKNIEKIFFLKNSYRKRAIEIKIISSKAFRFHVCKTLYASSVLLKIPYVVVFQLRAPAIDKPFLYPPMAEFRKGRR